MNMTATAPPAPSGSDRSFLDEAVASHAERLGRKQANRHKRNDLLAALVLVGIVFSATTAPSLLSSEAATLTPEKVACVEAGQRLAPWFRAEAERKTLIGLGERDDFNLLLTWFRNAQAQCASGQTARAAKNFRAIEGLIAERAEQRAPEPENE